MTTASKKKLSLDKETLLALAPDALTARRAALLAAEGVWAAPVLSEKRAAARLAAEPFHEVFFDFEKKMGGCGCAAGRSRVCVHQLALALFCGELVELVDKPSSTSSTNSTNSTNSTLEKLDPLAAGFHDLEIWVMDAVEGGLASLAADPLSMENAAARAVDGKLPAIGRQLRLIAASPKKDGAWHRLLLEKLAAWHLAVRAFEKRGRLPEPLLFDLMAVAGVPLRKDFIQKVGEPVRDSWLAIGQSSAEEEGLVVRKTWLFGQKTGRFALVLEFTPEGQPFAEDWMTGFLYEGEVVFYPSGRAQRAVVKQVEVTDKFGGLPVESPPQPPQRGGAATSRLGEMGDAFAAALAAQPWLLELPAALLGCRVFYEKRNGGGEGNGFFMLDAEGLSAEILCGAEAGWRLVAIGGGRPVDVFGTWSGEKFAPLSVFAGSKWSDLVPPAGLEKRALGFEPEPRATDED